MEKLYPVESFPYVSQSLNLGQHFEELSQLLSNSLYHEEQELAKKDTKLQKIAWLMGINEDFCQLVSEQCSIELLGSLPEEGPTPEKILKPKGSTEGFGDQLLDKATKTLATAIELKAAKSIAVKYHQKLREIKRSAIPPFVREPNPSPIIKVPEDFVLVARVYKPFHSNSVTHTLAHSQDFLLRGKMGLCSFRDKITCVNDDVVIGAEQGERPSDTDESSSDVPLKRIIPSSMFYFGNTFYCDMRDPLAKDYGHVIETWAKQNPQIKLGPFEHRLMEDCTIADLEIRLGFPYVFIHLGSCEHLITFLEARLMTPDDPQDIVHYPLIHNVDLGPLNCYACDTYVSKWIVEDDSIPTKPANLCDQCFKVYYTRKGVMKTPAFYCMLPDREPVPRQVPLNLPQS